MKLVWLGNIMTIVIEYNNGEKRECSAALWNRISSSLSPKLFDTINKYWESRSNETIQEWETLYRHIFAVFDERLNPSQTSQLIKPSINRIFQLMEWNHFRLWCTLHGNLFLSNGIKDTLDDKDKEGLTYYTKDYEDLMVFSVMLKAIMPIWAVYHNEYGESIGKYFIHISALNLIKTPPFIALPPIIKLENYIEHFVKNKIENVGFSLISGIGSEEIPAFLMSLALIKKVIIYDTEDASGSIVKNVYHLLTERCTEITKSKPNKKKSTDAEGADISISDRYKIIQRIPPAVSAMVESDCSNIYKLCYYIDPTTPASLIEKYHTKNLLGFNLTDYHLSLIAIIARKIIAGRTLSIISYSTLINLLRASAATAEHWGFLEIAEILTTIPVKRDIYQISSSITGNRSYNLLLPHLNNEITKLYSFQSNNRNPGLVFIENFIKEVIKYEWKVESTDFINLRNSIAELMLKQLGGETSAENGRIDKSVSDILPAAS